MEGGEIMNKTLMAGLAILVAIVILGGGYLLLKGNNSSTSNQTTQMEMTPEQNQTSTPAATTAPTAKDQVDIANFAFSPATITVKVGDSVNWTNKDSIGHSATADDSSWDTGVLGQGESKSITFAKAGTYKYHCSVHPNMHGTVVVQAQ